MMGNLADVMKDGEAVLTAIITLVVVVETFWTRHVKKGVTALRNGEMEGKIRRVVSELLEDERNRKNGIH